LHSDTNQASIVPIHPEFTLKIMDQDHDDGESGSDPGWSWALIDAGSRTQANEK
jgi:hypothetical protein